MPMQCLIKPLVVFLLALFAARIQAQTPGVSRPWIGVHVLVNGSNDLEKLRQSVPGLGKMGVNALIVEINYNFLFESHPELGTQGAIRKEGARAFADLCRT